MKEKKARVEDALHATRAAVEEGIVPGGGVALLRAQGAREAEARRRTSRSASTSSARALEEPLRQIATNAGVRRLDRRPEGRRTKEGRLRLQRRTDEYEDLVKAGVIDPTKVVRTALQNAASIASLLLTTEALVAEKPEEKKERRRRHGRRGHGEVYWLRRPPRHHHARPRTADRAHGRPEATPAGFFYFLTTESGRRARWRAQQFATAGKTGSAPDRHQQVTDDCDAGGIARHVPSPSDATVAPRRTASALPT